jgi:hypothetical protein
MKPAAKLGFDFQLGARAFFSRLKEARSDSNPTLPAQLDDLPRRSRLAMESANFRSRTTGNAA